MIKRIQKLLGRCAIARFSSLLSLNYKSFGLAFLLLLSIGNKSAFSQGVSIAFSSGYLGTQASATQQTNNIKSLATLGIVRASFSQSYAGTFGGTQGNDLSGTIRLYMNTGQIITLTGALNWRETTGNALDVFGLIFDPGQNATITYGSNQTYNIVGGSTNNTSTSLGLKAYASSVTFSDGSSRSGNAATSSIIQDINSELATSPQPSSITLTNPSVIEGLNLVYTVTLSTATSANRPQVFTLNTSGSAARGNDYSTSYTFSAGVVNNGDGTMTVPGGVSSFTVTVTTVDDLLIEPIENLILSVGSKSAVGLIRDNDVPVSAQCDVNNPYDKIISGYHQSIAFKTDGSFSVWGEDLDNSGTGNVLIPREINSTNYPNLQTATPLKAAIGGEGGGGSEQAILLTTAGLYAWGAEGFVIDAALTSSTTFAKILGNQFTAGNANTTTGLPSGVDPYDVKMMTASFGTLIILTNTGDVWTLSDLSGNLNANGSSTVNARTWYRAKTNSTTFLTDITSIRVQASSSTLNAVIALKADGTVYTWGSSTYLGNGSVSATLSYATQMTLPSEFSISNIPKMIAVTGGIKNTASVKNSFYLLSNNGALYSLGHNAQRQLGDFTTTEQKSWVNAKVNSTTNFSNVAFISAQEHDASFPGIAVVTKAGDLYTWGENEGLALGRLTDNVTYNPGLPNGFTPGTDVALSAELGGHTLVYLKQGTTQFCYVGHKTSGSMGDGVSTSSFINTFDCSGTPSLAICGSVPVSASTTTSTIASNLNSITANGTSTAVITVQLKQANGTNLTTTGGTVIINTNKGSISNVTDNNDGTYTAILTSSTFNETANITYTLNGSNGTNATTVTFIPLTPSITKSASFSTFVTCAGTASAAQSFTVSAANLTSSLTVTAPTGFELSTSISGTYSASIVLTQSSGSVSTTTLWARLKSSTTTSTSGTIVFSSTGATSGTISVSSQVSALPTITVNVIPDVTTSATTFSIPYTGLTGADVYSLATGTTSMTNFVAVSNASITASPLSISIPASAQNSYDFVLTVSNSTTACSIQRSFSLVVSDINPGTTGTDQAICFGATPAAFTSLTDATAGGAGSPTYQWQMSTTGVAGTYTDIVNATSASYAHPIALTVDTYFRRKATIGVAFGTAHPIEVIVNPLPVVAISPSSAVITTGSSVSLTAFGASTYSWSPSTGLSAANTAAVTATPTTTTTYTVTGTSSSCSSTSTVTVTVNPSLTAGAISANQTICVGAIPAALTSSTDAAGGTGSITYVWESSTDGTSFSLISGVASSTYSPGAVSVNTYFRRGASTANDAIVYSSPVLVTVQESVGGSIAGSATVCAGTNSTVLTLSGQTGSITKWQSSLTSNFASATDISNTAASLTATNLSATTYYRAVITLGSCTAANSSTATISVTALPSISVTPSSASITTGSSVSLTASGATNYSWTPSTGLSATNTAAVSASPTVTTTYTVTGTSSSCSSTATITVTVMAAVSLDTDGDGVLDSQEATDGTNPNDVCSYVAASQTLTPTSAWANADCDGDGTPNGTDTAPKDPCVFVAGATPVTTNAIWRAADCDGDGVTNGKETTDGTNPNDGCSYVAASKTGTPSAAWNALDCDGDGTPNGTDTAPKDPCVFVAGATPVTTNAIWRAADCDGDGVTNGKETDDGTDPNDGCSYVAASKTVTPSAAWNALDCDGDGTPNGTDTAPKDPCVFVAGATPVTTNAIWRAADCDGDGVTNGKETDDGTDPTSGCSFTAASKTLTPTSAWGTLDCDSDGNPNATDPNKDTPSASNDVVTVGSSGIATINILLNDDYLPGPNIEITRQTGANAGTAKGTVTFNPLTGEMTYKRAPFESGTVTLGYRVSYKVGGIEVFANAFVTILSCDLQDPLADCDGDGEPNGTDLAPSDPCIFEPTRQVKANVSDDWKALDCDGDGVLNGTELSDGTNPADGCSFKAASSTLAPSAAWLLLDCDADGISNKAEGKQDFDGDGIPNCLDTDSDGDSISDKLETTVDTDKDGKSDYLDLDSDNDGILDSVENKVCTGTGILCDTDADGFPNFRDLDSDGDQILDVIEANGADFNQDGIADGTVDEKGIPSSANKGLSPPDTDKDVKLDPYDVDSDGDGITDKDEEFNEDADFADCDKDGVPNRLDPDECEVFSPQGISPNGDGKNDRLVFKGLLLRKTPNHLSIYNRWGTLVFEMESYDNSFEGTLLPDGTYYYILDFFGKKPTISNYLSVDRTIK
jgi:gliding motility-associated-like protein